MLERLPTVTRGASSTFGISYRTGIDTFSQMRYIEFGVSDSEFEVSIGGSTYDSAVGSDSFSEPGWFVDSSGYGDRDCNLASIEDSIDEYLNLGAEITVSDEADLDIINRA